MTKSSVLPRAKIIEHACELPSASDSNLPKLPPSAKFYIHWKRRLKKILMVSSRHPFTSYYFRSRAAIASERKRHGRSNHWWVLHPCSDMRYSLDILITVALLYIFIIVPYIVSFFRIAKSSGPEIWYLVYPAFGICIVDIFFNFITGYPSQDDYEIFLEPSLIFRFYGKGYFLIDLISSLPYGLIFDEKIMQPGLDKANSYLIAFEFLPLLKVFHIGTFRNYIKQINKSFGITDAHEVIITFCIFTALIYHWATCITYCVPYIAMHITKKTMQESNAYIITSGLHLEPDWKIYLHSLHIGVSNLIGCNFIEIKEFGPIDKIVRCVLIILGQCYIIYFIIIILQLVESSVEPELKYQEFMLQVHEYVKDKKLPKRLRERLISYFEYKFQGSYFKEYSINKTLSNTLKQEVMIHSSRGLLEATTIFHNLPRSVLGNFMAVLKPVIYLKDDIIYKAGSRGDTMFFIASGTVVSLTFSGTEICHIKDGGYFGQVALIYPMKKRLESVITLDMCEVLRFHQNDFKKLFPPSSNLYERLEEASDKWIKRVSEIEQLEKKMQKSNNET